MARTFNYDIMPEIQNRWSPRAFDTLPIPREDVMALLEAAHYAPSCFNEQPWRFILADEEDTLSRMRSILNPANQAWASSAPVLLLIVSHKTFGQNGKDNYWHMFDAGTAWGFLSLEAERRHLITHAMAGFSKERARAAFTISDDYDLITVVAIGRYGNKSSLNEELQLREHPETRKDIDDLLLKTNSNEEGSK